MTSKKTFEEQWPRWPSNYEAPLQLVDIRVKLPVDDLFNLLYAAGSEFVVRHPADIAMVMVAPHICAS